MDAVARKGQYARKAEKQNIPTCNILGVEVAAINMDWLLAFTQRNLQKLKGDYMCVANVHTTVMAFEDQEYCDIQNGGIMAIPDGAPLSVVGRKRNYPQMQRTTGPEYMENIMKISVRHGYRHFFYGSTQETLKIMSDKLKLQYPGIQVVGSYSPPFRELTDEEDEAIVQQINRAEPDFVWVGLGAPKQEKWMADHQGKVNGFMVGVGAGFDYFAGNIKRAPRWMQMCCLEWLFRLMQEPGRLFKRYWHTNTKFIWNAVVRGK